MIQRLSDMFLLAETLPQEPEIVKSGRFFMGKCILVTCRPKCMDV